MSLMIKGMDMPKNCAECPILEYGSLEHYCPLAKERMWNIDTESGKHKNCPLSEISTPHGDLIDRDDLLAYFDRKSKGKTAEEALKLLYTALKAYPAVIGKEMNSMTILKHGDTPECVRYVCGNCGYEWKAQEIHVYNKASNETRYFRDCPKCGKIRVEGQCRAQKS